MTTLSKESIQKATQIVNYRNNTISEWDDANMSMSILPGDIKLKTNPITPPDGTKMRDGTVVTSVWLEWIEGGICVGYTGDGEPQFRHYSSMDPVDLSRLSGQLSKLIKKAEEKIDARHQEMFGD